MRGVSVSVFDEPPHGLGAFQHFAPVPPPAKRDANWGLWLSVFGVRFWSRDGAWAIGVAVAQLSGVLNDKGAPTQLKEFWKHEDVTLEQLARVAPVTDTELT